MFEEIIANFFSNLMKVMSRSSIIPKLKNVKYIRPRHILIKLHTHKQKKQ